MGCNGKVMRYFDGETCALRQTVDEIDPMSPTRASTYIVHNLNIELLFICVFPSPKLSSKSTL
jgi:hypothetical protein